MKITIINPSGFDAAAMTSKLIGALYNETPAQFAERLVREAAVGQRVQSTAQGRRCRT